MIPVWGGAALINCSIDNLQRVHGTVASPPRVLQLSHASGRSHYDLLFTEALLVLTFFCCCSHAPNEHILALDYYASGLRTMQNIILPILQMRKLKL